MPALIPHSFSIFGGEGDQRRLTISFLSRSSNGQLSNVFAPACSQDPFCTLHWEHHKEKVKACIVATATLPFSYESIFSRDQKRKNRKKNQTNKHLPRISPSVVLPPLKEFPFAIAQKDYPTRRFVSAFPSLSFSLFNHPFQSTIFFQYSTPLVPSS